MPPAKQTPNNPKPENTPSVPTQASPADESEVAAALRRTTFDGKGTDPLPESDFDSFATKGVEKDDLLSVQEVTGEMLAGRWGSTAASAMEKLGTAGYDTDAVWAEFQRRKAGGAPSAF